MDAQILRLRELTDVRGLVRRVKRHRSRVAAERRALPRQLAIEPTNHCNLHCVKCPTHRSGRDRGYLDLALFQRILQQVASAEAPVEIALSGAGEPTLHPAIVELVAMARRVPNVGVVGFATNAVPLTPTLAHALLQAGLTRLKVSLDSVAPAEFAKLTGHDVFQEVVRNIESFCDLNRQAGHPCTVTLKATVFDTKSPVVQALREQWAPKVDHVRITPVHNWGSARGKRRATARTTACPLIWNQIQILWDGQVTLCCMDSMEGSFNMGSAWTMDLSKYWRSGDELKRIRKLHLKRSFGALPVCAACNLDEYHDLDG